MAAQESGGSVAEYTKSLTDARLLQDIHKHTFHKGAVWLAIYSLLVGCGVTYSMFTPYHTASGLTRGAWMSVSQGAMEVGVFNATWTALVALLVAAVNVPATLAWLRSTARLRVYSCIGGVLLSWSVTFAGAGKILTGAEFADPVPRYWVNYFVYQSCRWIPVLLFFSALVAWLFSAVILLLQGKRQSSRNTHDDDQTLTARTMGKRFSQAWWHAWRWARPLFNSFRARNVFLVALAVFVLWLPWGFLMWPANIGPDTIAQLVWYRTGHAWDPSSRQYLPSQYAMSDHHPWLTTLLYGWFDSFGVQIGNEALGLWLLAVLHMVLLAIAFGIMITYCSSRPGLSWKFGVVATLFCMLVPIYGRLAMSVVKDLTFLPFFITWSVMYVEYIRRVRMGNKLGFWFLAGFYALAIVCGLTKKVGIYVIAASLVLLVIFLRRRVVTGIVLVLVMATSFAIPKVAYPLLHIYPGGKQEMMAIPLQQSAAVLIRFGNSMDAQDKRAIEAVYSCSPEELRDRFTTGTSDDSKDCFNHEATGEQMGAFFKAWIHEGLEHPGTYFDAVPWVYAPFLVNGVYDEGFFVHWGWPDKGGDMILPQYREHELSSQQETGEETYYVMRGTPVLSLFMSEGFYALWLPVLAILLCLALRRYHNLLYLLPTMITMGSMIIQPMHQFRYTWPLAFEAVLVAATAFMVLTRRTRDAKQ